MTVSFWIFLPKFTSINYRMFKIVIYKNLAIANRSHVSCAHNMSRLFIGLITLWPWNVD